MDVRRYEALRAVLRVCRRGGSRAAGYSQRRGFVALKGELKHVILKTCCRFINVEVCSL